MASELFLAAHPYQQDVLALPVKDIDAAAEYYARFGLKEVERRNDPPTVIMERDGVHIGFAENGGDPEQDGAAILVSDLDRARSELAEAGVPVGEPREDEQGGKRYRVCFIVAPDGLCYYVHQAIGD